MKPRSFNCGDRNSSSIMDYAQDDVMQWNKYEEEELDTLSELIEKYTRNIKILY